MKLSPERKPPILIWSDASFEPESKQIAAIGFVVAVPKEETVHLEGKNRTHSDYDWFHGSEPISDEFLAAFVYRKQQIGQLELLALLVPYLSMPEILKKKEVMHWVDNSSAVAAACKGYSRAVDSARIVHALHAVATGLETKIWFEYARSEANIADVPSRIDLSQEELVFSDPPGGGVLFKKRSSLKGLVSVPIPVCMPDPSDWNSSAADWVNWVRNEH